MKTLNFRRGVAALAAVVAFAGVAAVCIPKSEFAGANSGPRRWHGTTASGVTYTDADCPLQVEKEVLTFDLSEFPSNNGSLQEYLEYSGQVTADYTFKNPTENEITATLAFPFGREPSYAPSYDSEGNRVNDVDTEKYTVKIDGADAHPTLRHTLCYDGFDFDNDVKRIRDDFATDDFYKTDLPVYKYTFTVTADKKEEFYSVAEIPFDKTKIKIASYNYDVAETDGGLNITWYHQTTASTVFYAIGGEIDISEIQWKFYREKYRFVLFGNSYYEKININNENVNVNVTLSEQVTFKDFALSERQTDSAISEVDYYNGVVDYLNKLSWRKVLRVNCGESFEYYAMRWYVYDMTVAAGQTVQNSVTVPVYPTINGAYASNIYRYEYYLSPAAKWASFGEIEIIIDTPNYLVGDGEDFTKTDDGYKYTASGLPQGELEFSLSAVEDPYSGNFNGTAILFTILLVFAVLIALAIVGVGIWAIVYSVKRR